MTLFLKSGFLIAPPSSALFRNDRDLKETLGEEAAIRSNKLNKSKLICESPLLPLY